MENQPSFHPQKVTESSSAATNIDKMTVSDILYGINQEDAKVHMAVKEAIPQIAPLVEAIVTRMQRGGRLFYLGAGTSGRLGVLDASEIPPTFGMPENTVIGLIAGGDTALRKAVEKAEDDCEKAWDELLHFRITSDDTVIGIAASGSTPYVVGGITAARGNGILTGCITCHPNSEIAKAAEFPIEAITGPEFITGSTRLKAGSAQKMILNMLTTTVMIKLGRTKGNKMVHMQLNNQKLINRGTQMLVDELGLLPQQAKALLLKHGSVVKAIDSYRSDID